MITIKTNSEELLATIISQYKGKIVEADSWFSVKTLGFYYSITFKV